MVKSILLSRGQYESRVHSNAATPRKQSQRRSNSRPRRDARRQQAELDMSFYDDSVVEDFIQKAERDRPAAAIVAEAPPAAAATGYPASDASATEMLGDVVATVVGDEKRAKIARLLQEFRAMDNMETPNRPSRRQPSLQLAPNDTSTDSVQGPGQVTNPKANVTTVAAQQRRRSTKSAMIVSSDEEEGSGRMPRGAKKAATQSKSKKDRIRKIIEEAMSQQRGRSKRSFVVIDLPSSPSAERSNDDGAPQ